MSPDLGAPPSGPPRRRMGPVAGMAIDALKPSSPSLGCLFPVLLILITLAAVVALAGHVVPWALYPAL